MIKLEKLLYALRASMEQEELARNMNAVTIQRIEEIVRPAIKVCNENPDCQYTLEGFEMAVDQIRGLSINVNLLIDRENSQFVRRKSLSLETSEPFEEKAGEILTAILKKPVRVVVDSKFFRK